ncbi:MAG: hypothetical protein LBU34_17150 [Planctomycetaceae bacterium]|nr:hypothetical protein [Planctomycetaceae bacterium]
MCITLDKAKHNLRIGISQPDTKSKGRRRFAETPLADRQSKQPTLYKFPVG